MDGKNVEKRPDPQEEELRREQMRRQTRFSIGYLLLGLLMLWMFQQFLVEPLVMRAVQIPYSEFKAKLRAGEITEVSVGETYIVGRMKDSSAQSTGQAPEQGAETRTIRFDTVAAPGGDPRLIEELDRAGVKYTMRPPPSPLGGVLLSWLLPILLLGGLWYLLMRRAAGAMGGGMGGLFSIGKSKATAVQPQEVGVSFKDVGGADEAIDELREIIQFLQAPEQFASLGGRIPKGVLLVGPPGTGKTLLAKATAGEAGVAFFQTSGSEFVEMFVGVGAARVRDLFEQARKAAPAIVFIDEIDAIGQSRAGAMRLGGNDEREQTLNQLLAEIDGFKTSTEKPVIIMAASNRPEVLDLALLRAGRFDRQVAVGNPDLAGRLQILKIHSRTIKLSHGFDLERAARITPGFSGADLANVMNEAALLAARRKADAVALGDFEAAIERIVAGLERKSTVMNEQERTVVAYHEAGHALVATLVPHADPVAKISIVPRGKGALGYTLQMPAEDRYLLSQEELEDRIAVLLGGRAAEQVAVGRISTGAGDDIARATDLARRMVTEFGMSEKLGSVRYAGQKLQYLGGVAEDDGNASARTREIIDEEVQRIVTQQQQRARGLLEEHREALETLSRRLLECESLDGSYVRDALGMASRAAAAHARVAA